MIMAMGRKGRSLKTKNKKRGRVKQKERSCHQKKEADLETVMLKLNRNSLMGNSLFLNRLSM